MKIYQKISFKIILLLAVLFCSGVNAYSNYIVQPTCIELLANTNSVLNCLNMDTDPIGDDQITHNNEFSSVVELSYQIPQPHNYFLIIKISFSIWQPPKIS